MFLVHVRDGIQHLEARLNLFEQAYNAADAVTPLTYAHWVEIFKQSLEDAKRQFAIRSGHMEPIFFDARIIYVTARVFSPDSPKWYLEDFELKRRFPQHIVGFDLVGHKDLSVPLRDYAAEFLRFQSEFQARRLEIPFLPHTSETLGDSNRTDDNLYVALLDIKRIGHDFSMAKHPVLIDMCIQREVCIKVSPISNELLRYTGSIAEHSLTVLLNRGMHMALSNDDPCQFGNFGLSHLRDSVAFS